MKNRTLIIGLVIAVVGIVGFMAIQTMSNNDTGKTSSENNGIVATVYKSPTCGCCGVYTSYMKKQGYNVQAENVQNMSTVKQEFGIPYELESCHTMEVGGYVVEGHIPEEAIQRLLAEKPDIKGIGMAGMPSGSPGMPGPKTGDFVIYEITSEGARGDVFMTI
jgi:hypothetical protein